MSREDSSLIYCIKTDTVVVPKNIYDLLSGFYRYRVKYLRNNLPVKHAVTTTTFFIDEIWDLTIRYHGKKTINTIYGPVLCLKVKPDTIVGHFFRTSDAMTIWFTNNDQHIPVKFLIELRIGTLQGIITNYERNNIKNTIN